MIAVDCRCGHAEVVHDGKCGMASCGCTWYRRRRRTWRDIRRALRRRRRIAR